MIPPTVLADPPAGYSLAVADRFVAGGNVVPAQLWTSDPQHPESSAWAVVTATPTPTVQPRPVSGNGQSRLALSDGVGIVTIDGAITKTNANIDGGEASISAVGLDMGVLAAILNDLQLVDGRLNEPQVFADHGFRLLASRNPADNDSAPAHQVEQLAFHNTATGNAITVLIGQPVSPFDRALRTFMLRDPRVAVVGGIQTAIVGTDSFSGGRPVAIVDFDGTEVVLQGGANPDELLTVAASMHLGDNHDWQALTEAATRASQTDSESGANRSTATLPIAHGTFSDTTSWSIALSPFYPTDDPHQLLIVDVNGPAGSGSGSAEFARQPNSNEAFLQPLGSASGVLIVAYAGRAQPGSRIVVTTSNSTQGVDLTDPGEQSPGLFAVVGIQELVSYHAELRSANGEILATLDGT